MGSIALRSLLWQALSVCLVLASLRSAQAQNRCAGSKTHKFVGFKGRLTEMEHNVRGEVEILDDCSFRVTGFSYDGRAPSAYWWGAKSVDYSDFNTGFRINNERLTRRVNDIEVTVELSPGLTWDRVPSLGLWCEDFSADFGHVTLGPGPAGAAPAAPAATTAAVPAPPAPPAVPVATVNPASQCNGAATHPFVGFQAELTHFEHNVGGTVTVIDDCTFTVADFTYDGRAPAVYWWGANSFAFTDLVKGKRLNDMRLEGAVNGALQTVSLRAGVTWNDTNIISVWCEEFEANFGNVNLRPVTAEQRASVLGAAGPAVAPVRKSPLEASYENCIQLKDGVFNMYWKLDNANPAQATTVRVGFESVGPANQWVAFGYSLPTATQVEMIGSDVTIAGYVGAECFATDYQLNARSQCNYESGQNDGVCPDAGQAKDPAANNVKLLNCSRVAFDDQTGTPSFITTIEWERPLKASDRFDNDWPVDKAQFAAWAYGPLSEASDINTPVVLYHAPTAAGVAHAGPRFQLNLGAPLRNCTTPVGVIGGPGQGATKDDGFNFAANYLSEVTTIDITTGDNAHYPNPPAWGLSYHLNLLETPVMYAIRGQEYTFRVMATESHPFYITTSTTGAAGRKSNATVGEPVETIFAGGPESFGTVAAPYTLKWTPDKNTPNVVYYQCYIHQKLGWQVKVFDTQAEAQANITAVLAQAQSANKGLAENGLDMASCTMSTQDPFLSSNAQLGIATNRSYGQCQVLGGINTDYTLMWSLFEDPSADGGTIFSGSFSAATTGYAAFGIPIVPGQMVGASAIIVKACSSCPTGASVDDYYLAAQEVSGVQPPGRIPFLSKEGKMINGKLTAFFAMRLQNKTLNNLKNRPFNIIYAVGSLDSGQGLTYHGSGGRGSAALDLASGNAVVTSVDDQNTRIVHGVFMAVSFGLLIPAGVVIARNFREYDPLWFNMHIGFQVTGFILGTVGFGLGLKIRSQSTAVKLDHFAIGCTVFSLMGFQILLACLARPNKSHAYRWAWNQAHWWTGRIAIVLAIVNIYLGLKYIYATYQYYIAYSVLLAAIIATSLSKSTYDWMRVKGDKVPAGKQPFVDQESAHVGMDHSGSGEQFISKVQ